RRLRRRRHGPHGVSRQGLLVGELVRSTYPGAPTKECPDRHGCRRCPVRGRSYPARPTYPRVRSAPPLPRDIASVGYHGGRRITLPWRVRTAAECSALEKHQVLDGASWVQIPHPPR